MLIGYARVSTDDQLFDLQRDALAKVGCERLFEDTASGLQRQIIQGNQRFVQGPANSAGVMFNFNNQSERRKKDE